MLVGVGTIAVGVLVAAVLWLLRPGDQAAPPISTVTSGTVASGSSRIVVSQAPTSTPVMLPGSSPTDSSLVGGQTDHLQFARLVARAVLAYGSTTDFQARNDDLLRAAAPSPYGDSIALAQDLKAFTPEGAALKSLRDNGTTVTVDLADVTVSDWAAGKLEGIGASPGVYGVDLTGQQTILTNAGGTTRVQVRLGITVACPPATEFCTLDRVLPQHLQQALGSG